MATPSVTQLGDVSRCLLRAKEWAELEDDLWEAPEDPEQKSQAGNAVAVAHAAVKGYFKTHLQFPVLVKQNGANNVTQIPCKPQLEKSCKVKQMKPVGQSGATLRGTIEAMFRLPPAFFESFESLRLSPRVCWKSMWAHKLHHLPVPSGHTAESKDQFHCWKKMGKDQQFSVD